MFRGRIGDRIGTRRIGRDRAVIDDPAPFSGFVAFMIRNAHCAHRKVPVRLASTTAFHFSKGRSSTGTGGCAGAGIVEEQIEPREALLDGPRTGRPRNPDSPTSVDMASASHAECADFPGDLLQRLRPADPPASRSSHPRPEPALLRARHPFPHPSPVQISTSFLSPRRAPRSVHDI